MKATMISEPKDREYRLTGRIVLLSIIGFFAVVMGVNGIMAYLAVDTFSGVQSEKPYENGLAFNRDIARARAQDAQGWSVSEKIIRSPSGEVSIDVSVADSSNQIVFGLAITSVLKSPVDSRIDCKVVLTDQMNGHYTGVTPCGAGQWDVETIARQGAEIVYQSTNRIILH
jgi:nitrogen fixation protein FixH